MSPDESAVTPQPDTTPPGTTPEAITDPSVRPAFRLAIRDASAF
jgi:hypothetical protein